MPSKSAKQHRFMEAVAHGMKPRKGGPSAAVAKEFVAADKAGELEQAEDTRQIDAMHDQVKRRTKKIKGRRNRSRPT